MAKLSKKMQELMDQPMETLMARTRGKKNDFGVLSDEEKQLLHRKVAVNLKLAKEFKSGAIDEVQFFVIDDNPKEDVLTPVFKRGDIVKFVKNNETQEQKITGFKQTGSRSKVTYEVDGREISFAPAGMSIDTEVGTTSIPRATVITPEK